MKMRERLHRILAGALAVIVLCTSEPVISFAQTGEAVEQVSINEETTAVSLDTGNSDDSSTVSVDKESTEADMTLPEEDMTTSEEETTIPGEGTTVPEEETMIPGEGTTIPEEETMIPGEGTTIPEEESQNTERYALEGRVFVDFDEDGEQDEDEESISGVTIRVYAENTEELVASVETNEDGIYRVEQLKAGIYTVEIDVDDESSYIYNFAALAETFGEDAELPSEEDTWEFRRNGLELTEDTSWNLGLRIDESLLMDMDLTVNSEELTANKPKVTRVSAKWNGKPLFWTHVGSPKYEYCDKYVDDNPGLRLFCLNRSITAGGTYTKHNDSIPKTVVTVGKQPIIKKIAYYSEYWPGWGNLSAENATKIHLAAQMLIWDNLYPDSADHRVYYKEGSNYVELNLNTEKEKIMNQVQNNGVKPSFTGGQTWPVVRDNKVENPRTYTFTDTNRVLSQYVVESYGDGVASATINGNKLTVVMKADGKFNNNKYAINFKRKPCVYNGKSIENASYTSKDKQPVLLWGQSGITAVMYVNYIAESPVWITKTDNYNKPVSNVRFRWGYSKNSMTNLTGFTDGNGQTAFTAKCPGPIYVQEESVPQDIVLSTDIKTVEITPNHRADVTFVNQRKHTVTLKKIDSQTKQPIEGAEFEYYDLAKPTERYTGTTDSTGSFSSKAVFAVGTTVVMTEISSGPGHLLPKDVTKRTQRRVVTANDSDNVFRFENDPDGILFRIIKLNSRTEEPIEGLTFRVGTDPELKDPSKYRDIVTNKDGIAESIWPKNSQLYYQEIDGPDNIQLDTKIYKNLLKFTIPTDPTEYGWAERKVHNDELIPICVKKTGSDGKPLKGVQFSLQKRTSTSSTWKTVETLITSQDGTTTSKTTVTIEEVEKGLVQLKEVSLGSNTAYTMLEDPIPVTKDMFDTVKCLFTVPVKNPKIPTELSVYKYDEKSGEPLYGAWFEITDSSGNVVTRFSTNGKGNASTTELYANTVYYLEETRVPDGYKKYGIYKQKQKFIITEEGKVVSGDGNVKTDLSKPYSYHFEVPNTRDNTYIEIYKKDDSGNPIPGIEFTISTYDGVETLITDEKGYARSKAILWRGYYEIRETYCPPEYIAASGIRDEPFVIFSPGSTESYGTIGDWSWVVDYTNKIITYTVTNTRQLGTVTVKKVDSEYPDMPVKNAEFRLENLYTGVEIGTAKTDENGIAVFREVPMVSSSDPKQGYYRVKEIASGDNHVLTGTIYKDFSLTKEEANIEFTFQNPPFRGTVEIKKVDKDDTQKTLKGAEFKIYKAEEYEEAVATGSTPEALRTLSTDGNGIASFGKLRLGNYIIKETNAPKYYYFDENTGGNAEYWDADLKAYRVTISENEEVIPLTITNNKGRFQIIVHKTGHGGTSLSDVSFDLCKADGTWVETIKTDIYGVAESKEYYIDELGEGAYVVEKGVVPGYKPNTTHYTIDFTSTTNAELTKKDIYVANTPVDKGLKLQKLNEDGKGVKASFEVTAEVIYNRGSQTTTISEKIETTANNFVVSLDSILNNIDSLYSRYPNLPCIGTISIEEISTEAPYKKIEKFEAFTYYPQNRQIVVQSSLPENIKYDENTLTLTLINEKIPIKVDLKKVNSSGEPLEGAEFTIQPNNPYDKTATKAITGTTDQDGSLIFENLPYAESYTITETKAPEGYINKANYTGTLENWRKTVKLSEITSEKTPLGNVTAYNYSETVRNYTCPKLYIRKVGPNGEALDARFSVETVSKKMEVTTSAENDGYGEINLSDFYIPELFSTYELTIKETWVDSNYTLFEKEIPVDLNYLMYDMSLDLTNTKKVEGVTVSEDGAVIITVQDEPKQSDFYMKKKAVGSDSLNPPVTLYVCEKGASFTTDDSSKYTLSTTSSVSINDVLSGLTSVDGYDIYIKEGVVAGYKTLDTFKAFSYYPNKVGLEKFEILDEKHIEIESSSEGEKNAITISLVNEPIPARILLKKVDAETKEPLAGATFEVTASNGYKETFVTTGSESGDWLEMPYAQSYSIKEKISPKGYKAVTDEEITLSIDDFTPKTDDQGDEYYEYTGEVVVENSKKYDLYFNKVDSFGNPVEATFRIEGRLENSRLLNPVIETGEWTINTQGGKANLTPILQEMQKKLGDQYEYQYSWKFSIYETGTEGGLLLYGSGLTPFASFTFRPHYCGYPDDGTSCLQLTDYAANYVSGYEWSYDINKNTHLYAHFTLKNDNIPISLTLYKEDSDTHEPLPGAVFEITPEGKNPIEITTGDDAGGYTVTLPYAKNYRILEKSAPDGYEKDGKIYNYSIDEFDTTKASDGVTITAYKKSVTYENTPTKGKIQISKYDEANPNSEDKTKLAGAKFGIYSGTIPETGTEDEKYAAVVSGTGYTLVQEVTIGAEGTVISNDLPAGTYVIAELEAPANYQLSHKLEERTIIRNAQTVYISYPNKQLEGSLSIFKYQEGTTPKEPLANAGFRIYDAATNTPVGDELFTRMDGRISITLPYGRYYIKETTAPSGYVTVSGVWENEITIDSNHTSQSVEVPNKKGEYGFRLIKVNDQGEYLAGAEFGVYAKGVNPYEDSTATPVMTFETDASGMKFVALEMAGDYDIYELKAPDGYETVTTLIESIHVDDKSPVVEVNAINSRQKMTIHIHKVDANDNTVGLRGAKFEVYSEYSEKPIDTIWTDENGDASLEVPAGDIRYTVKEVQAPDGYVLDTTAREVTVLKNREADGTITYEAEPLTIQNEPTEEGTGVIRIIKLDQDTDKPLEGAVFNIEPSTTGSTTGYTVTTNSEGVAEQANVPFGEYFIEETEAPEGYKLDTNRYSVTLDATTPDATVEQTFYNTPIKGGFRIKKVDAEDNSQTLQNAEFAVFASNSDAANYNPETPETGKQLAVQQVSTDGIATFEELRYGTYYVRETKAPDGYSLSNEIKTVTVDENSLTSDSAILIFEDEKASGTIRVIKKDADTGELLSGATFYVEKLGDGSLVNPDGETYETDANGTFETKELSPGTYRVTELTPPSGYLLSSPEYQDVTITADLLGKPVIVVFYNPKLSASVKVTKTDKDGKPLANAWFGVYKRDENDQATGTKLDTLITGLDGTAVSGRLLVGKYILVEEKFPAGYKHSDENVTENYIFDVDETTLAGSHSTVVLEKTIKNDPVTGSLKIVKTDSVTHEGLNGAEFTIYRYDDTVYAKITTENVDGTDGIAVLNDIPYGMYYVRETGVPEGYRNTGYYQAFRITDSDTPVEVVLNAENTPIRGTIGLIKIDADHPTIGVPNAVYGIYKGLTKEGTVDTSTWLGESYNLTTTGTWVEQTTDEETNEVIPAHYEPKATISKELPYGTYYVKEITSPANYLLNDEIYTVQIREEQTYVEITAEDKALTGSVSVKKVNEQNKPLSEAEFTIYTKEEFETLSENDKTTGIRILTDGTGIASYSGLSLGVDYVMIETKAPAGYELDTTQYKFKPTETESAFSYTIPNHKKDEIVIRKVDDRGNPLVLAIFGLYSVGKDGKAQTSDDYLIGTFGNADSNEGYARYETAGLEDGKYYVKELQKPEGGYILSDEIVEIELTSENRSFKCDFKNYPYDARLNIRKIDEKGEPLTGAEFALYEREYKWDESLGDDVPIDTLKRTISMENQSEVQITGLYANRMYLLRETKAPAGYARAEDMILDIDLEGELKTEANGTVYYEQTVVVENKPTSGKILIQKQISNDTDLETELSLAGAKFEIRNDKGTLIDTLITGEDGTALSNKELSEGIYKIKETQAPEGTKLNTTIGEVNINGEETDGIYTYTHTNPVDAKPIIIEKVDEDGKGLPEAVFEIIRLKDMSLVDTLTTEDDGFTRSRALPYGKYMVREVASAPGHTFGTVISKNVVIDADANETTLTVQFENPTQADGPRVRVVKYDKDDTKILLAGAEFALYDKWTVDSEGNPDVTGQEPLRSRLRTLADGYVDITGLDAGQYVLVETKAPDGYVLDQTPHLFTTNSDQSVVLYIDNEAPKGRIEFVKTGEVLSGTEQDGSYAGLIRLLWSEDTVDGAEIGVYTTKALRWNNVDYAKGDLITTVKSGEVSEYLPLGEYTWREVSAPSQYLIDSTEHTITVTDETGLTAAEPVQASLKDEHGQVMLELYKKFSNENMLEPDELKAKYEKVKFGVYTDEPISNGDVALDGNTLVAVFGVNENGVSNWTSQKLPEGKYYVKELETAEGYVLDSTSYGFTVSYKNQNSTVKVSSKEEPIINQEEYGLISLTKVGHVFTDVLATAGPGGLMVNTPVYTEAELAGAEIEVRATSAVTIGDKTYQKGEAVDTLVSDNIGRDMSIELPLGTYELVEIEAPAGYILDSTPQYVTLSSSENEQTVVIKEVTFFNRKSTVTPQIYKSFFGLSTDDAKTLYPDVLFGIYAAEEIRGFDDGAVLHKDTLVQLIEIGADGSNKDSSKDYYLPEGNYYIKEIKTADTYALDEKEYPFKVEADSADVIQVEGVSADDPIVNYPENGEPFAFRKIDENGRPLSGATFALYRCNIDHEHDTLAGSTESCWEEIVGMPSKASGDDGIVDFGKLPDGDYQLVEISAPDGYETPKGQWYIQVDTTDATAVNHINIFMRGEDAPPAFMKASEMDTYQYQLPNNRSRDLPLSGGPGVIPYLGSGGTLLSAAALLFKKRRKEEPEEKN